MNVLSLFDGMSCGRLALERAGIKVDTYYASEIDKYAQIVSEKNYPDIVRLGSVVDWQNWDLPHIDMIIGGSPCQGFSNAGKGLNFDDPRSKLFFTFVDIVKALKPKYFLLENVMMKKEWQDVITEYMGVDPIMINSALLSAQNRKRLYWTNIPDVGYPCGKDIILADIVEDGYTDRQKSFCLDANYARGGNPKSYFERGRRQLVFVGLADDIKGHDTQRRIYSPLGKSPTLSTMQGGNQQPKIMIVPEATQKGYTEIYPNEGVDLSFPNSKTRRGRRMSSKSIALTAGESDFNWYNGLTYRKLTVKECERLQTLPDNYTEGVSNSQRYKMIGNGWTVDVISHIFSYLPEEYHEASQAAPSH